MHLDYEQNSEIYVTRIQLTKEGERMREEERGRERGRERGGGERERARESSDT